MPSSIKLTEPLDILVEYGYLDEDKPYHKALNNAVMEFAENPDLGGEYNKHYVMLLQKEAKKELKLRRKKISASAFKKGGATGAVENIGKGVKPNNKVTNLAIRQPAGELSNQVLDSQAQAQTQAQTSPVSDGLLNAVKSIAQSVDRIKESLIGQGKFQEDAANQRRKLDEEKEAKKRESGLEKLMGPVKKVGEKLLKPFRSIWDSVLGFLSKVFFGRIAMQLFDWFANPENISKVKSIFNFIKDWWPLLVAGLLAIIGPGVTFAVGLVALVAWGTVKIVDAVKSVFGFGPKIDEELKRGQGDVNKSLKESEANIEKEYTSPKDRKNNVEVSNAQNSSQEVVNASAEMAQGGEVKGQGGVDNVPAMLTAGEFVMSKGAVQQYGADTLSGMNAAAGGDNKPKYKDGKVHAFGGGQIDSYEKLIKKGGTVDDNNYGNMREVKVLFPEKRSGLFGRRRTRRTNNFVMRGGSKEMNMPIEDFINMKLFDGGSKAKAENTSISSGNTSISSGLGVGAVKDMVNMGGYKKPDIKKPNKSSGILGRISSNINDMVNTAQFKKIDKPERKIDPPSRRKPSTTSVQAQIAQGSGDVATVSSSPAAGIPSFDAGMMRSQSKIRSLGIAV